MHYEASLSKPQLFRTIEFQFAACTLFNCSVNLLNHSIDVKFIPGSLKWLPLPTVEYVKLLLSNKYLFLIKKNLLKIT